MLPPLPADGLLVVPFDALEVALAKLDIKVPLNDIIAVAREEEAMRRKATADATERRTTLPKRKLYPTATRPLSFNPACVPLVAFSSPAQHSGLKITTTPKIIPNPPPRATVDPLAKERRRRLIELTKEAFPDGVPTYCKCRGLWECRTF